MVKITEKEYLKQFRERNPTLSDYSDSDIIAKAKEKRPDLEFEWEKWVLEKVWSWLQTVSNFFNEAWTKVLEWIDNAATDLWNLNNKIIDSALWWVQRVEIKPARHMLGLKDESDYKWGLLANIWKTIKDSWELVWQSFESIVENPSLSNIEKETYNIWGNIMWGVVNTLSQPIISWLDTIVPDETQQDILNYLQEESKTDSFVWNIVNWLQKISEYEERMKIEDPEKYREFKAAIGFIDWLWLKWWKELVTKVWKLSKNVWKKWVETIKNQIDKITKYIDDIDIKGKVDNVKEKFWDVKWIIKTSKEDVDAISPEWVEFNVEKTPKLYENITDKIFLSDDNVELATKSIFPKISKEKWTKAKLEAWENAYKWVEQLYNDKAAGIIKADIHDMWWAVEWIDEALEHWWKQIWNITKSDVKIDFTPEVKELTENLLWEWAKFNKKVYNFTKELVDTFWEYKNILSVKWTQEALSNVKANLFSSVENIKNFNKSAIWKKTLDILDKMQNKLDDTIEKTSGNSEQFLKAKENYTKYKRIQKDLLDSYLINQRNSGKWLSWMAGQLWWAAEILQNPFSASQIAKWLVFKHIWDLIWKSKTRSWNWEKLIRNLDREAIKRAEKWVKDVSNEADDLIEKVSSKKVKMWKDGERVVEKEVKSSKDFENSKSEAILKIKEARTELEKLAKNNWINIKINLWTNEYYNTLKFLKEINKIPKKKKNLKPWEIFERSEFEKTIYKEKQKIVEKVINDIKQWYLKWKWEISRDWNDASIKLWFKWLFFETHLPLRLNFINKRVKFWKIIKIRNEKK